MDVTREQALAALRDAVEQFGHACEALKAANIYSIPGDAMDPCFVNSVVLPKMLARIEAQR